MSTENQPIITTEEVLNILKKNLGDKFVYGASIHKNWIGNGNYMKIWAAASDININGISGQKPQVVSLAYDFEDKELRPQVFGGNGGQSIYREPNKENPAEKHLAMQNVKIPFRKPQPEKDKILKAIDTFFKNYLIVLRANKDFLTHKKLVDYDYVLS